MSTRPPAITTADVERDGARGAPRDAPTRLRRSKSSAQSDRVPPRGSRSRPGSCSPVRTSSRALAEYSVELVRSRLVACDVEFDLRARHCHPIQRTSAKRDCKRRTAPSQEGRRAYPSRRHLVTHRPSAADQPRLSPSCAPSQRRRVVDQEREEAARVASHRLLEVTSCGAPT